MILELGNGIERTLGKILGTQDLVLKELDKLDKKICFHIKENKEVERRVDKLENRMMYATGIAVCLLAVFSVTSDVVLAHLGLK